MKLSEIGITSSKEKQFNTKGICTVEELVRFLPRKYNDLRVVTGIIDDIDMSSTVVQINDVKSYKTSIPVITAFCLDVYTQKRVTISWFHQQYMYGKLRSLVGKRVFVAGKFVYNNDYNNYSISNPTVFDDNISRAQKLYPIYPKIPGMSSEYLMSKIDDALSNVSIVAETLPPEIVKEHSLCSTEYMLKKIHNPTTIEEIECARNRMIFDDLLFFALRLLYASRQNSKGSQYNIKSFRLLKTIAEKLPFDLTGDQKDAVNTMCQLARGGQRINSLVMGDVGTGKTIVAFLMMLAMIDSGYQVALMAPTQVLAKQHYDDFCELIQGLDIPVAFLSGNKLKKSERETLYSNIKNGTIKAVIGTHSILNSGIEFKSLALTVADEEHKFGVLQRKALIEKASAGVHSITMSATPIPRSLAQVIYTDEVQLHTIKTIPIGKKPVKTYVVNNIEDVKNALLQELCCGRQAYIVCPMIDKNESLEGVLSVEEVYEIYDNYLKEYGFITSVLTGKNDKTEVDDIITNFKNGNINVLIATTVIEVGVNVPNASLMIIHNAERFGLSGLHQLRGRVGRGCYESSCLLVSNDGDNPRLLAMVETTDGFKIAEEDLRLRGAGDFLGTKQSGDDKYIALMLSYPDKYQEARQVATKLLDSSNSCALVDDLFADEVVS